VPIQRKKTNERSNKRFSVFGFEAGLSKLNAHFPTGGNMVFVTQFYTTVPAKNLAKITTKLGKMFIAKQVLGL
jgi:hypothetical protein